MRTRYNIIGLATLALLVFAGCSGVVTETNSDILVADVTNDVMVEDVHEMQKDDVMVDVFTDVPAIALKDVEGGNAVGQAWTSVRDGVTNHRMIAENLPALTNGDFYEGWIVSSPTAPGGVVSTGVMTQQEDGTWLLLYGLDQELPDHTTVVLTREPDDGDPAPATHVLEEAL